jgi:hypothetical protein
LSYRVLLTLIKKKKKKKYIYIYIYIYKTLRKISPGSYPVKSKGWPSMVGPGGSLNAWEQ